MSDLLRIENLQVDFQLREGTFTAVDRVSLAIPAGRVVALVGESGCGKSVLAKSILGILPPLAKIVGGHILLAPEKSGKAELDIAQLPRHGAMMRSIRGRRISMIFQEPMASLSPVHTIGEQIAEVIRLHEGLGRREALAKTIEILRLVRVPSPERRVKAYPHELSGGLRQRAMIAMALACRPQLVIADEPTTALDVTIQAQVIQLLRELQRTLGMAILIITHDLAVVAQIADRVAVMYFGSLVEQGPADQVFRNPRHPYTQGLLQSIPRLGQGSNVRLTSIPGSVPGSFAHVPGCPFHPRCPKMIPGRCDVGGSPEVTHLPDASLVSCHLYSTEAVAGAAEESQ